MTSIFPSPCWLIWMVSPRLPVRPSTLMRSLRNFSKAWMSKILSLTGCEQLMMNFFVTFWFFLAAALRFYIQCVLSLLFWDTRARERPHSDSGEVVWCSRAGGQQSGCTYGGRHLDGILGGERKEMGILRLLLRCLEGWRRGAVVRRAGRCSLWDCKMRQWGTRLNADWLAKCSTENLSIRRHTLTRTDDIDCRLEC